MRPQAQELGKPKTRSCLALGQHPAQLIFLPRMGRRRYIEINSQISFQEGASVQAKRRPCILRRPAQPKGRSLLLSVLTQGNSGDQVRQLQQLLNGRIEPSSGLRVDGVFGAKTLAAVMQFQQASTLRADGKVERDTWLNLLFGDTVHVPKPTPTIRSSVNASKPGVPSWSLRSKFEAVLSNAGSRLPGDLRFTFGQLISLSQRKSMAENLAAWAVSQAERGGESIDCGLFLLHSGFSSLDAFNVVDDLNSFLDHTSNATEEKHLEDATAHFARVVSVVGVTLFIEVVRRTTIKSLDRKAASNHGPSAVPTPMRGRAISSKTEEKIVRAPDSSRKISKPLTKKAAALQAARKAATPFSEICDF